MICVSFTARLAFAIAIVSLCLMVSPSVVLLPALCYVRKDSAFVLVAQPFTVYNLGNVP